MPKTVFSKYVAALTLSLALATTALAKTGSRDIEVTPEQAPICHIKVPPSDLSVTAWVDHKNADYRAGDQVKLFVKANQDAYITVLDVGTSGKVYVIFPNKYQKNNHVLAHQVVEIPSAGDHFHLTASGPAGPELLQIFATTDPKPVLDERRMALAGPFKRVNGSTASIARDIVVRLKHKTEPQSDETAAAVGGTSDTNGEEASTADAGQKEMSEAGYTSTPEAKAEDPATGDQVAAGASDKATEEPLRVATHCMVIRISDKRSDLAPRSHQRQSAEMEFRRGERFYFGDADKGDYRAALVEFRAAAAQGHVQAMLRIGLINEKGLNGDRNTSEALRWYQKAAKLGNAQAMVRLARLYGRGLGVARNITKAIQWLQKAAATGDGIAMLNLSKMYDTGHGVSVDAGKAARFALAAIRAGAWTLQENLPRYSEPTRRAVQKALKEAGAYEGVIDGKVGPETRAALAGYARAG